MPGRAEKLKHCWTIFCEELSAEGHGAGGNEIANAQCHAFADTGNSKEKLGICIGRGQSGELRGLLLYGFRRPTVGADAEGIGAVNLKEGGSFFEQTGLW